MERLGASATISTPAPSATTDVQGVKKMSTNRHADFERIRNEFIKYYGGIEAGDREYKIWLKALNLDETKSYAFSQREKFSFLKPMLQKLKEDKENVYYKVLVGFPLTSMNDNLYTQSKLSAAADGLVDAFDCNLNHLAGYDLPGVRYVAAKFEDGAVEAVLKVPKSLRCNIDLTQHMYDIGEGKPLYEWIDEHVIVNQSLEASEQGGFHFVGSALLTKDTLPGIPLSRIFPLESVVSEALSASQKLKGKTLKIQVKGLTKETNMSAHSCPTGQHWDANKGSCVPDEGVGKTPQGTDVSVGKGAADDNSKKPVEADYPWDQCISDMQAQGHDADSAARICAAIKNGTVSQCLQLKLAKTPKEAIQLIAERSKKDPLFAYLASEVERLKTSQSAQVISSLNVAKTRAESALEQLKIETAATTESIKRDAAAKVREAEGKLETVTQAAELKVTNTTNEANAKIKAAELKQATAEEQFIEESKRRQKADGRVEELEKANAKMEKQISEGNQGAIADGTRMKNLERRLQDSEEEKQRVKDENEKLVKKNEELDGKYREQLKKNLDLSKELTSTNEELLKTNEAKEKLDGDLKKAKRLAKITVNM